MRVAERKDVLENQTHDVLCAVNTIQALPKPGLHDARRLLNVKRTVEDDKINYSGCSPAVTFLWPLLQSTTVWNELPGKVFGVLGFPLLALFGAIKEILDGKGVIDTSSKKICTSIFPNSCQVTIRRRPNVSASSTSLSRFSSMHAS